MSSTLPPPASNQPFWNVSAVEAGELSLPVGMFIPSPAAAAKLTAPSLSFLLRHSASSAAMVFDLGMRKDYEHYPPAVVNRIKTLFQPVAVGQDVRESLEKGGLPADAVTHVCLSHVHWDHIGDATPFRRARFLVGAAARPVLAQGFPHDPHSLFASGFLPEERTTYLDPHNTDTSDAHADAKWAPVGPFPRALDFFGDGSLYVVDAPGHMPGHLNVLARTSADGGWVYLAGDSAHDWRLVTGEAGIPQVKDAATGRVMAAHADIPAAEAHIARIRALYQGNPRVRVLLAHNAEWYKENKGGAVYWPGGFQSL
ncbi:Metallo-hydrolase/oxidoreductase [Dentipellis sp. KUC8613]|nr:Metallo-hydrolase/oxidoreductase [Dentipellis sp. KUC8613]